MQVVLEELLTETAGGFSTLSDSARRQPASGIVGGRLPRTSAPCWSTDGTIRSLSGIVCVGLPRETFRGERGS